MTAVLGSILPPTLPKFVHVERFGKHSVVHVIAADSFTVTGCALPLKVMREQCSISVPVARRVVWCPVCFPGLRCRDGRFSNRCRRPSGKSTQCREHVRVANIQDQRMERAA